MRNAGNIERLKVWRQIAESIRKGRLSDASENEKMSTLSGIMEMQMQYDVDSERPLVADALQMLLMYITNNDYITHDDVLNGLSLFTLICDVQIKEWLPKPVSLAKVMAEELDELPF
jgi:hypothetical protein